MRTREQIVADCEKRFEELRREAQSPSKKYPCATCRFGWEPYGVQRCREPLVVGHDPQGYVYAQQARLCGPEKALWQRKLTICERIIQFLTGETP